MSVITFTNTKTAIPGLAPSFHLGPGTERSYSYRDGDFLISLYGSDKGLMVISVGLTVTHKSPELLETWVKNVFGSKKVQKLALNPGEIVCGVWRPGLYSIKEINQALNVLDHQRYSAEQALYILIQKLSDILLYVEPDIKGKESYGHKIRELLILSCTEVENYWKKYLKVAGVPPKNYTTNDYVKLLTPLHLAEYEVVLKPYAKVKPLRPFAKWSSANPSISLSWYNAYNQTKHDRETHFNKATLKACIDAVAANIVMFSVRFGPFSLYESQSATSSHFNQLFAVRLHNPDFRTFYVPKIDCSVRRPELVCGQGKDELWVVRPLIL